MIKSLLRLVYFIIEILGLNKNYFQLFLATYFFSQLSNQSKFDIVWLQILLNVSGYKSLKFISLFKNCSFCFFGRKSFEPAHLLLTSCFPMLFYYIMCHCEKGLLIFLSFTKGVDKTEIYSSLLTAYLIKKVFNNRNIYEIFFHIIGCNESCVAHEN